MNEQKFNPEIMNPETEPKVIEETTAETTPIIEPEDEKKEQIIETLSVNDFAIAIGLKPNEQGRFTFGSEHIAMATDYAANFKAEHNAEGIIVDGIASPAVLAALLHGVHPAEIFVTYQTRDAEKNQTDKIKVLDPIPEGKGKGPDGFIWNSIEEKPKYVLVSYKIESGIFNPDDLDKVVPPEIENSDKTIIISGKGPNFLNQSIAAAYRHYKGGTSIAFYQPASKFGPAKCQVGISHDTETPLGLEFGEPDEIETARKKYDSELKENLNSLAEALGKLGISTEVNEKTLTIKPDSDQKFTVHVQNIRKG
jgi:hypothetical protein